MTNELWHSRLSHVFILMESHLHDGIIGRGVQIVVCSIGGKLGESGHEASSASQLPCEP